MQESELDELLSAELECAVCLNHYDPNTNLRRPRALPCGHSLCTACAEDYSTCPTCSSEFKEPPINYQLEGALGHIEVLSKLNTSRAEVQVSVASQLQDAHSKMKNAVKTYVSMVEESKQIQGAVTRTLSNEIVRRAGDAIKNINDSYNGGRAQLRLMGLDRPDDEKQGDERERKEQTNPIARKDSMEVLISFVDIFHREMAGLESSLLALNSAVICQAIDEDPKYQNDPELRGYATRFKKLAIQSPATPKEEESLSQQRNSLLLEFKQRANKLNPNGDAKQVVNIIQNGESLKDDLKKSGKSYWGWVMIGVWGIGTAVNASVVGATGGGLVSAIAGGSIAALMGTPVGVPTAIVSAVVGGLMYGAYRLFKGTKTSKAKQ
mmetsp:Transcript_44/g.52  ORF Transcript_44/g.52 Transcript_44/m.52 type:complete len:380 (-) Transcript_44:124-1263(-)